MSKIALITGITGQDGSYLAELLLKKDYEVHGIVRPNFSTEDKIKNWRIQKIIKDLHFHKHSIENAEGLKAIIKKINPLEVYHLAAQAYDGHSFDNELYTFNINLNAMHFVISSIREINNKAKIFFAGSSEMYGDGKNIPINEKTLFVPSSAYGIAKVAGYYLIKNYRLSHKMHTSTGILFNHESPRRDLQFVTRKISHAAASIKKGLFKNFELGNLNAKRDWGHAKDYVRAMWMMLQQEKADDYVIGTGELKSVEEFADKAFKYVGLNYKDYLSIDEKLKRKQDLGNRIADITKAKNNLKWKPEIDFDSLVEDMVESELRLISKK